MVRIIAILAGLIVAISGSIAADVTVLAEKLSALHGLAITPDQKIFATTDAGLVEIKDGKSEAVAVTLKKPQAIISFQQFLFVADQAGIQRVDLPTRKSSLWVDAKNLPVAPEALRYWAVDERGTLYASDGSAQVIRIASAGKERKVTVIADPVKMSQGKRIHGIFSDSLNHLLIAGDRLVRLRLSDSTTENVAELNGVRDMQSDAYGRFYYLAEDGQSLMAIPRPGMKPVAVKKFATAVNHMVYDANQNRLLVTETESGTLISIPAQPPGFEVDMTPLPLKTEIVFEKLNWTGYDNGAESGKEVPLRPVVLTHAGDGSNRIIVATQQGVIHSFKVGDSATNVMLDLQSKCFYKDTENEQGLLGLAFHPQFKSNGELFVFYTDKSKRFENVLSRFKMKKDNPNQVDPASEEELMRYTHRYWNHDGGTVAFGPDGMLYVVLGDGGSANDPDGHGQKRDTLLGKILRIDVNRKDPGLNYAIPKDNPFVADVKTRPEIFALGVRNPWRLSFDRKSGQGWFGEVGQNLWEEINLLEKGANYGWSVRESLHPFGPTGTGEKPELTEPIWEYHHSRGKSITGGFVSRGNRLPELDGMYIYADYVFAKIWALQYDAGKKRVVANRPITDAGAAVMSFGEDESGEIYILTYSANGKGISRIVRK
jgi:glucose/arabinose dehydrogenase